MLASCALTEDRGTLAQLRDVSLVLEDATVENGLDKAMDSYRAFLEQTPETAMTPEAIRRIADLSIEKEYGYVANTGPSSPPGKSQPLARPAVDSVAVDKLAGLSSIAKSEESEHDFEQRAAYGQAPVAENAPTFDDHPAAGSDLENANARQAIELYQKLLAEYPLYDRNDQVLYQLSRAYEELGEVEKAMEVMNQFVLTYPDSRYMDEIQFRRAEFYFTRKKYLDAEEAYGSIVNMGPGSYYFELALYKLGWTFYKQESYEEALSRYIALLDYKVSVGYDFAARPDPIESKRVEDTFRVISLSFSNLGGPEFLAEFFSANGPRSYEDQVYRNLAEFYFSKRRYADAAGAYNAFIDGHPFHEVSPHFAMRTIEIYHAGRFAQLVIDAKKDFANTYALDGPYWQHFEVRSRPDVVDHLKSNLKDLANHYHAMFQDPRFVSDQPANYHEALLWYRNYLASFPRDEESPDIHYQMAGLMLENKDFRQAGLAYEYTAYDYPQHAQSAEAGYAAVYAYREHLKATDEFGRDSVKQEIIRTSLTFADTFPQHDKVTIVLGAAADDLYEMKNYSLAVTTARRLLDQYPGAEPQIQRSAWLVAAHGSFDLARFADAEQGYLQVLEMTDEADESLNGLIDNLAASIYKQGEEASIAEDPAAAADHFLRVSRLAPTSTIRPNAEYDAATALIKLEDWTRATDVLLDFRTRYPEHQLQPEVTKKIALVYKSDGKLELAGAEYERIESEAEDEEVRRGALLLAADLYEQAAVQDKQLSVYKRYVEHFPSPVESALEIYNKMAKVYQAIGDSNQHLETLRSIVAIDKSAGPERSDRTRYLAAEASLVLTRPYFNKFAEVRIVDPVKDSLEKKQKLMKSAIDAYTALLDYEVADVTAAATFYMAEIYLEFSQALASSERPTNLSDLEMEQYELALEEQIYPFEEKSIDVHRKNVELLHRGVYSDWIDKSIGKLAEMFPALYARDEEHTGFVETIDSFHYEIPGGGLPSDNGEASLSATGDDNLRYGGTRGDGDNLDRLLNSDVALRDD